MNLHYRVITASAKSFLALCFLFGISMNILAQKQSIRVESSFNPNSVSLGSSSVYKVIVHGTQQNPQGSIPSISGLNLSNNPQTFRSASFINGVPSVRLEMSFQARPSREGNFTIPAWNLSVGGSTYSVPQSSLRVLPEDQHNIVKKQALRKEENDLRQAAFIEFSSPRPFLFEGETVKAEVSLFLWDRLPVTRIEQAPVKKGDEFSMSELSQPNEQRNYIRSDKSYSVYTWSFGLTGAISGKNKISFATSIRVRSKNRSGSPFNSPFFNDPFFGFGREESIQVLSKEQSLEVRPLPINGRPKEFQGAIGSFSAKSFIDADRVSLGDPVKLTFELTGTGNFEAMPAPNLAFSKDFKVGPPAFSFSGNLKTKHEGTQSFEYIVTPLSPGLLNIPEVLFCYFDPLKEEFFSILNPKHPIRVDPGEKWIEPEKSEFDQNIEPKLTTKDLFQTESEPGEWVQALRNSKIESFWIFWVLQGVPLSGVLSLLYFGFVKRKGGQRAHKQKEAQLMRKMKDSASLKNNVNFFRIFRNLLQLKISSLRNHPNPSALSSEEILSLIKEEKNDLEVISQIEEFLRKCDDLDFAKVENTKIDLAEEHKQAIRLLKKIR